MSAFSNILCVVDPTRDEQPALNRAAWLAKSSGAALILQLCYYDEHMDGQRLYDSRSLERARAAIVADQERRLDELAAPLINAGLNVSTNVLWDHPLDEAIVREATRQHADVVIKDVHHHSAISRAFFTHTDWSLIRTCPVALWLVSPISIGDSPKVIAAIDPFNVHDKPATLDDRLLRTAKSIVKDTNGTLHAFHCFDPAAVTAAASINTFAPAPLSMPELENELLAYHESKSFDIAERHGIDKDQVRLATGAVHERLPAFATELGAALVVMGAVSRGRLERFMIGATAERTLARLHCDLLVIKPSKVAQSSDTRIKDVA